MLFEYLPVQVDTDVCAHVLWTNVKDLQTGVGGHSEAASAKLHQRPFFITRLELGRAEA